MVDPVEDLTGALLARHLADRERFQTTEGLAHAMTAERVVDVLSLVAKSDDVGLILAAELAALQFDLDHRVNSAGMQASLNTAIRDLKVAEISLELVHSKKDYQLVKRAYLRDQSRIGALPRDEARQFFKSHFARLLNQDKSGLDDRDKHILACRRANITRAERLYTNLQCRALGLPEKSPPETRRRMPRDRKAR